MEQSEPGRRLGTFGLVGPPLVPFPFSSPTRVSSSVRQPGSGSRLRYTGHRMASKQVSSRLIPEPWCNPGSGVVWEPFDASSEVRLRSSPGSIHDAVTAAPFNHDVHYRGFWPKQLMAVSSCTAASISRTARRLRVFLTQRHLGLRLCPDPGCRQGLRVA